MKKRLTIALVAHDNRKADMVEWVKHNAVVVSSPFGLYRYYRPID